jgi:hypothetical protein
VSFVVCFAADGYPFWVELDAEEQFVFMLYCFNLACGGVR